MKVLIAGYGSIGARHLRLFQEMYPQFEYAVLRRPESNPEAITGAKIFTEPSAVAAFAPNLVMICNPTYLHADLFEKLAPHLAKGTAVFFEKPYAHTLDDLEKIASLVQTKKFRPFYGCILRYHLILKIVKEWIKEEKLGVALSFEARCLSYLPNWRPKVDYRKTYSAKKNEGGGVLFDLIHEFDYVEYLFGEINSISGKLGKFSDLEIDSDDYCNLSVCGQKINGVVELSYSHNGQPIREFAIRFDKCRLSADFQKNSVIVINEKNEIISQKNVNVSVDDLYKKQIFHIVESFSYRLDEMDYFWESIRLNRLLVEFSIRKQDMVTFA